jgi:hypothetical protein
MGKQGRMGRMKIQNEVVGLYSQKIQEVKDIQVELVKIREEIRKRVKQLDKDLTEYIQKEWDKSFPNLKVWFLAGCEGGCLANNWEAHVFFYNVDEKDMFEGKFYETYANDLHKGQVRQVKAPISMARLKAFLRRMNQETGATCQLSSCDYVKKCLRGEYNEEIEKAENQE